MQLSIDLVPDEIKAEIAKLNGRVKSFFAIKTDRPIPVHRHQADREVYFGGDRNGIAILIDSRGSKTHEFNMGPYLFTIVNIGGSHGLYLPENFKGEYCFFGIKF